VKLANQPASASAQYDLQYLWLSNVKALSPSSWLKISDRINDIEAGCVANVRSLGQYRQ